MSEDEISRDRALEMLRDPARLGSVIDLSVAVDHGYSSPCWIWTGYRDRDGYGVVCRGGINKLRIHRISHIAHVGPIPAGMVIDHLCAQTSCWNPDHLEAVTSSENSRRMVERHPEFADALRSMRPERTNFPPEQRRPGLRTHCKRGHEFNRENTVMQHGGKWQSCRICRRERQRERRAKQHASP
jgi:hypothetical protein